MKSVKKRDLVIFGLGQFAQIADLYFTESDTVNVRAFLVEDNFKTSSEFLGKPVLTLDEYCSEYNPFETFFHVAVLSHGLNTQRKRLFTLLKSRGLTPLSYISPNAYVHASAKFGEHVFIFEDNTVQPFTSIGEGVILWSGNHIGHHSNLGNYSLITSQVVVSGNVTIGDFDYLGVNATITNNVILGRLVMVNANAIVAENVPEKSIVKSTKGTIENLNLSRIPYFDETYLNID